MSFLLSYIILAQIFAIAALSTNLLVGIIGIFSVSQAAIMGIGAYACALLLLNLDVPFFVALAGAIAHLRGGQHRHLAALAAAGRRLFRRHVVRRASWSRPRCSSTGPP